MTAYYNEIDPYAAQCIRNLIAAGHIAAGDVDERSIEDVKPDELMGYTQCHFFAGVGVWSYALRNAGWPDDRQVWTGSCPCQPFSTAGKGAGFDDERHLWPHFQWLIQQCQPAVVFGEQVASKTTEPWIDLVHADMEAMGYAFGCVPFPSAGVGAPHIRDRAYWVANASSVGRIGRQGFQARGFHDRADAGRVEGNDGPFRIGKTGDARSSPGPVNGFWSDADWLGCRDAKWRPVESGTFPLVDGAASRVGRGSASWDTPAGPEGFGHRAGRLKGYGNAINAYQAQIFIESAMEAQHDA